MHSIRTHFSRPIVIATVCLLLAACSRGPNDTPDKTIGGAVLGAAWGAGSGAVIGHQVGYTGEGAGIGAGFGAVSGGLAGLGFDQVEDNQYALEKEVSSLKIQSAANARQLKNMQRSLDKAITTDIAGGIYQVFFDDDATSLRSGAIQNLEVIADSIRQSPHAYKVKVVGHTDDAGNPEYNQRLSESRARGVTSYLAARGVSLDQIIVESYGSTRPIASNSTPVGRQLNRRVDIFITK